MGINGPDESDDHTLVNQGMPDHQQARRGVRAYNFGYFRAYLCSRQHSLSSLAALLDTLSAMSAMTLIGLGPPFGTAGPAQPGQEALLRTLASSTLKDKSRRAPTDHQPKRFAEACWLCPCPGTYNL